MWTWRGRVIRELSGDGGWGGARKTQVSVFHMNLYEYWIYYDFQPLLFDMIFHNNFACLPHTPLNFSPLTPHYALCFFFVYAAASMAENQFKLFRIQYASCCKHKEKFLNYLTLSTPATLSYARASAIVSNYPSAQAGETMCDEHIAGIHHVTVNRIKSLASSAVIMWLKHCAQKERLNDEH